MTIEELRQYLEWRFRRTNSNGYLKYMKEWIDNVLQNPGAYNLQYYEKELKYFVGQGLI